MTLLFVHKPIYLQILLYKYDLFASVYLVSNGYRIYWSMFFKKFMNLFLSFLLVLWSFFAGDLFYNQSLSLVMQVVHVDIPLGRISAFTVPRLCSSKIEPKPFSSTSFLTTSSLVYWLYSATAERGVPGSIPGSSKILLGMFW